MQKSWIIALVLISVASMHFVTRQTNAGENWPCEALLCLSNPGGPRQYAECHRPMDKLDRWLFNRRPFPKCQMAKTSGLGIRQGYERHVACTETYGPGYVAAAIEVCLENCVTQHVCRKITGYRQKEICDETTGECETHTMPIYDQKLRATRATPHYVEIQLDGQQTGQRHYYKIKSKNKGMF